MLADLHLLDDLSTVNFDNYFIDLGSAYGQKVSKLASRVGFYYIVQHEGQSVDEYLANLTHLSIDCGLCDQQENSFKNQFVVGLTLNKINNKILETKNNHPPTLFREPAISS